MSDKSSDKPVTEPGLESEPADEELQKRRGFLIGLGRWSKIVIGAAIFGGLALPQEDAEAGWVWVNRRPVWINRHRWINRHGWINRYRRPGWGNWINRRW